MWLDPISKSLPHPLLYRPWWVPLKRCFFFIAQSILIFYISFFILLFNSFPLLIFFSSYFSYIFNFHSFLFVSIFLHQCHNYACESLYFLNFKRVVRVGGSWLEPNVNGWTFFNFLQLRFNLHMVEGEERLNLANACNVRIIRTFSFFLFSCLFLLVHYSQLFASSNQPVWIMLKEPVWIMLIWPFDQVIRKNEFVLLLNWNHFKKSFFLFGQIFGN